MRPEDLALLAIAFLAILLFTIYRIRVFRNGIRLRREIERLAASGHAPGQAGREEPTGTP